MIEFGPFRLDPNRRLLFRDKERVHLTPKEFNVLLTLVENRGRTVTKEEIMSAVWPKTSVGDPNLPVTISKLRKALGTDKYKDNYIETIPGEGYLFRGGRLSPDANSAALSAGGKADGKNEASSHLGYPLPSQQDSLLTRAIEQSQHNKVTARPYRYYFFFTIIFFIAGTASTLLILWVRALSVSHPQVLSYSQLTHDGLEKDGNICTDGSYVYFSEFLTSKRRIAGASVHGGETVYIPTPATDLTLVDFSPHEASFLTAKNQGAYAELLTVPRLGGSPRPLEKLYSYDAAWSPDGRNLAYVTNDTSALFVANGDGTQAREILGFRGDNLLGKQISRPRWSPDSRRLRFTICESYYSPANCFIWEIAPDGSHFHALFSNSNRSNLARFTFESQSSGSWTPDGKYFVFEARQHGRADIWALREEGSWFWQRKSEPVRLTHGAMEFQLPISSTDGRKLFVYGKQQHSEIVRYAADSGLFLTFASGISGIQPDVSPDGQWITYVALPEFTLWRSRIDGSEKLRLTSEPSIVDSPHWSPDGQRIAFRASLTGEPKKIFVVSRSGGFSERLSLLSAKEEEGVPTWSPDGNSLVFGQLRWHPERIAIHLVDLRTKNIATLPGSGGLWTPRWSPDGRYLLALAANPKSFTSEKLYLYDFRTQKWRLLIKHLINEPAWSHDSKFIYFDYGDLKERSVVRVRINDGKLSRIVDVGRHRSLWGTKFSLAADDAILLTRDVRNNEVYALDLLWP